ncbi:hypothetical protein JCM10207_004681 [Rhodosporidiobolus poonsookiae]
MASTGPLVPRVFQTEAVKAALERNCLIRADTGSGKTLVAILLIRELAASGKLDDGSIIVFLTPTVSLVHQQATVLQSQTLLKIKALTGADGVDFWKRERWQEQLRQTDVAVLTPQIFLDVLSKAYWTLDKVALIVFDESHHAGKRHPYAEIMRQHYHPRKAAGKPLPKILGLTASPIWNVKNPAKAISDLEALLDVAILEVGKKHSTEIAAHAPKASERLVEHPLPSSINSPEVLALSSHLARVGAMDERWSGRLLASEALFGSAGARLLAQQIAAEAAASPDFITRLQAGAARPVHSEDLSPKMQALVAVLEENSSDPNFHCIVFVEQRHHAQTLATLLALIPSISTWVRPSALTGHGGRGRPDLRSDDAGMAVKEQTAIVAKFRTGECNLLVATRIAEEGLDFRRCSLVIRFDALTTITGYIQSRGRARAAHARYVVIAGRDSPEAAKYKEYVEQEAELLELYAERPDDRGEEKQEPELDNLPTFTTSAGALLTYQGAIPLLAEFTQLLKVDSFTARPAPHFSMVGSGPPWTASLTLPKICALGGRTTFTSVPMPPTKKSAKQQVAFEVCLALLRAGAIDEYLLPVREVTGKGAKDADGKEVDRTVLPKTISIRLPNVFGNVWSASAYLHVVELASSSGLSRLGLVCGSPDPSLVSGSLFAQKGSAITVKVSTSRALEWASVSERDQKLLALEDFNRTCTRIALNRRINDERFHALWTPVAPAGDVDWTAIESAFQPLDENVKEGDLVVVPFRRPSIRLGRFSLVRKDVTSSSPTLLVEPNPPAKKRKAMERYSDYWLYARVAYDYPAEPDENEAIVQFQPADLSPYNALRQPRPDFEPAAKQQARFRTFPAAMVRRTLLPLDFWQSFCLVPSFNRLIFNSIHAAKALEAFNLPAIPPSRLIEALTVPGSGGVNDYETLEFVGDAMLKFATSVHIYLEYPVAEEDRMTRLRENSVDNRFLRRRSLDTGYASFILPHTFRPTTFVPETADGKLSEDGLTLVKDVGRRILSDTMESVLGAAVVSGGLDAAMLVGERLGLCFGGTTPWNERPSARALLDIGPSPAPSPFRAMEKALGYTVRTQGKLFAQAFAHRSYVGGSSFGYEREEYLGDALLDFWVTDRLYALFPHAPPRSLTYKRALLVSGPTLSFLALRKLQVHKTILHSSPTLEQAMLEAAEQAEGFGYQDAVDGSLTWLWSPPKVLGDVLEALLAVIFIDSGMQLDPVFAVLDKLYGEIMALLGETEVRDPHSRLLMWRDARLCTELGLRVKRVDEPSPSASPSPTPAPPSFSNRPTPQPQQDQPHYVATATFHSSTPLSLPRTSASKQVARQLAARDALAVLEKMDAAGEVDRLCGCKEAWRRKRAEEKAKEREKEGEGGEEEEEPASGNGEGAETTERVEVVDEEVENDEERAAEREQQPNEETDYPKRVREY